MALGVALMVAAGLLGSATAAPSAPSAPIWIGAFFDPPTKVRVCRLVNGTGTNSDCDHMTIVFGPSADVFNSLVPYFDTVDAVRPLAYARDAHGSAMLLNVAAGEVLSMNDFQHTTVSTAFQAPYTPVYSNCLWRRVVGAAGAVVGRDERGNPEAIALPSGTRSWRGLLPARDGCGSEYNASVHFDATPAELTIFDPTSVGEFAATVCPNYGWDRKHGVCIVGA